MSNGHFSKRAIIVTLTKTFFVNCHFSSEERRRGFHRKKLQQQRQTLKIEKDFACEAQNLWNLQRFHIFHCSCFLLRFFLDAKKKTKKTSRNSCCKNDDFFFVKIRFLGLGGQEGVKNGPFEGDFAFIFFISPCFPFFLGKCSFFFLVFLSKRFHTKHRCSLRSRCSMEMWCPDDTERDSWDWVGPPT